MVAFGDVSTGAHAMGAVACALLYRERTGRGQHLDISLLDTYFHYHEAAVQITSLSGGATVPTRCGRHAYYLAPAGIFKSREGYLIIAVVEHQWPQVCAALGRPELATDPLFATNEVRLKNLDALIRTIEDWLEAMPSDDAAMEALARHRVPFAPVLSVAQAMRHPHMRERGTIRTVHDRLLGDFELPGFALRFSEFRQTLELDAPFLGEHNEEILTHYLGYPSERVRELEHKGILNRGET
jgi:crotonobetainyl-CoA:carnitine CoA-transferase CaiB-like acyl-CoA transferase